MKHALEDSILICHNTPTPLFPSANPNYSYTWSPNIGLNSDTIPNPIVTITEDQTYMVTITNLIGDDTCAIVRTIHVYVPDPISLEVIEDTATCADELEVWASSPDDVSYTWAQDPQFSVVLSNDSAILIPAIGETTLYARIQDSLRCTKEDTVTIIGNGIFVQGNSSNLFV